MTSLLWSKLINLKQYCNINGYLKKSTNPKLDRSNLYNKVASFEHISRQPHYYHFHTHSHNGLIDVVAVELRNPKYCLWKDCQKSNRFHKHWKAKNDLFFALMSLSRLILVQSCNIASIATIIMKLWSNKGSSKWRPNQKNILRMFATSNAKHTCNEKPSASLLCQISQYWGR